MDAEDVEIPNLHLSPIQNHGNLGVPHRMPPPPQEIAGLTKGTILGFP